MRLSELFEDAKAEKERKFQMAWVSNQPSLAARDIPPAYYGNVKSRANELMKMGMDVDDSITTAASEVSKKLRQRAQSKSAKQVKQAPKKKPTTPTRPDRTSKSGKKWGNQYYSDPASSGGIKGALAKSSPKALAKRAAAKVDQEIGDMMDIDKVFKDTRNDKQL